MGFLMFSRLSCVLLHRSLVFVLFLALLAGCENNPLVSEPAPSSGDEIMPIGLRLPAQILAVRNVNPENISLEVTVNGNSVVEVNREEMFWTVPLPIPEGEATKISLTWVENFQQQQYLPLASWELEKTFYKNESLTILEEDYDTIGFDADEDGASNLAERNASSNPFDNLSTPSSIPDVDVIIPLIPDTSSSQPIIDGIYEASKYQLQNSQFFDTQGDSLSIDNLMRIDGIGPLYGRSDGDTEMRWFAMHDKTNLYIFVEGEQVDKSTPNGDSQDFWNDTNLNIFLDGNNSKGSIYDGIDDVRIEIPLLNSQGEANSSSDGRFLVSSAKASGESTPPPFNLDIEFGVCVCTGPRDEHTWEVKIPMQQAGLNPGSSFGIDIQIDLDHDGGARDIRWGWFHPAESDTTWITPSTMATGYLQ